MLGKKSLSVPSVGVVAVPVETLRTRHKYSVNSYMHV